MRTLNAGEEEPREGGLDGVQLDGSGVEFFDLPAGQNGERTRLIVGTYLYLGNDALALFANKN